MDVADILKFVFHKHVELRKLILHDCWLGEHNTGLLENILALCQELEVLSLESCELTSTGYCFIPHLKKLSELNLSHAEVHYVFTKLLETHDFIHEDM